MKPFDFIVNACAALAALLIPLIMLGVSLDVAGRFLFAAPLGWIFEVTEYALLCIPFLAMAWLVRMPRGHVAIDVVVEQLPPAWQRRLSVASALIAAGVCAAGAWWGAAAAWDNHVRHVMTVGIYPLPKAPFLGVIALGFALSCVEFARLAVRTARDDPPPGGDSLDQPDQGSAE
jgi:C4-dicarboxylate transporter DctQ subunit